MYQYVWDPETGGLLLTSEQSKFSKEPRPVYYRELDILGFDRYWSYPKDDSAPLMWAEANNYIYRGRTVAKTKGGSLYSAPSIVIIESPEDDILRPINIEAMILRNQKIVETLTQETIQKIYNTYRKYKSKVDVFYVAFSGGKDSIVVLDLAQRALPHDQFKILFGDTQMEFPDTYDTIDWYKEYSTERGIDFIYTRSRQDVIESWRQFGPPATTCRWCCSVHKTTPQILALREIIGKKTFTGMAIVGVRGDESVSRSEYDDISFEKKHKGQYNFNAILDWNSAEVYLYIYQHSLYLNNAYKKGNRRVGCLICPRAAERSEFFARDNYPHETSLFVNCLKESYSETFSNGERLDEFIQNGGWKARKSGRDIKGDILYFDEVVSNKIVLHVRNPRNEWKEWIKTLGILLEEEGQFRINYGAEVYSFDVRQNASGLDIYIDENASKRNPQFIKFFKNVFRKSAYCIGCQECEANCHNGSIKTIDGQIRISDNCIHCLKCHQIEMGCLVAASRKVPKEGKKMVSGSLNRYSHHAPRMNWFEQFFTYKDEFEDNHSLGSKMIQYFKMFLRDANLLEGGQFSHFAELIDRMGLNDDASWALMLTNLSYTAQINWFINSVGFFSQTKKSFIILSAIEAGTPEGPAKDVWASLTRLVELPFSSVGLGEIDMTDKKDPIIVRTPWRTPEPRVILYSLYKFAEACGDYYQFTLENLMDDSIERDGVSPTRIFGLDKETMIRILNGLAVNYPEFVSVSFTLDLDNITLRSDKSPADVLRLF